MKKNGFTLIELLAVIVILAIIALIATPIILGIINDARKESNERSAELYASAVRNAIATYQLTGTKAPSSFADLSIQYDGEVECETEELYSDGGFYITDCTVNGIEVDYTYGEQQVTESPRYYAWNLSGRVGETVAPTEAERLTFPPTGKDVYLAYEINKAGVISTAYSCFKRNNIEYCLKPNDFDTSTDIIKEAYADDTDYCFFDGDYYACEVIGLYVFVYSNGRVETTTDDEG